MTLVEAGSQGRRSGGKLQALRLQSWCADPAAPRPVASSCPRERACVPCVGRWTPNPWASWEVLTPLLEVTVSASRRRQWHPTPVLLPGKSHGGRSLVGRRPWGRQESGTTEQLHFHFSLSRIGEEDGNPLQCSCLENLWGRAESDTTEAT